MRNTFKVYERLKREQHINTLFRQGKAFSVFPIRVVYQCQPLPENALSPVLTGFSVPKKKFHSSVHRHRIRRLMVEAWRHHKHALYPTIPAETQLHIFFIFTGTELPTLFQVTEAIVKGTDKLKGIMSALQSPPSNETIA